MELDGDEVVDKPPATLESTAGDRNRRAFNDNAHGVDEPRTDGVHHRDGTDEPVV